MARRSTLSRFADFIVSSFHFHDVLFYTSKYRFGISAPATYASLPILHIEHGDPWNAPSVLLEKDLHVLKVSGVFQEFPSITTDFDTTRAALLVIGCIARPGTLAIAPLFLFASFYGRLPPGAYIYAVFMTSLVNGIPGKATG
jgi:hypothetical protein